MLLDDLMPTYDVVERHATVVRAPSHAVFAAIRPGSGLVRREMLRAIRRHAERSGGAPA